MKVESNRLALISRVRSATISKSNSATISRYCNVISKKIESLPHHHRNIHLQVFSLVLVQSLRKGILRKLDR